MVFEGLAAACRPLAVEGDTAPVLKKEKISPDQPLASSRSSPASFFSSCWKSGADLLSACGPAHFLPPPPPPLKATVGLKLPSAQPLRQRSICHPSIHHPSSLILPPSSPLCLQYHPSFIPPSSGLRLHLNLRPHHSIILLIVPPPSAYITHSSPPTLQRHPSIAPLPSLFTFFSSLF